jgi:ABC-type nitrate/sulfonate/bicarbonate transport system substrate-binding protein
MKRISGISICMVMVALMGSASYSEAAPKLRIGIHRAIMGSHEVISHKIGYWKKEGLNYSVGRYKQGKLMRNAIIQGNLDVGTTGFSPFTTATSKGAKVQAIGVTASVCGTAWIVIPKGSKLKIVADFKGITFANKKGTSTDFAFQSYVLPRYGLKSSDIQLLSVNTTDRLSALISGNAQAGLVGDPVAEVAHRKGTIRKLENLCKYDDARLMHVGNPDTLEEHPDLFAKYFRSWLKSHQLYKKDLDTYAKVYLKDLKEVGTKTTLSLMIATLKGLKSQVFITPEVKTYLNDMGDKQVKLGWIKRHPDFTKSKWLDDSILRKAARAVNFTN